MADHTRSQGDRPSSLMLNCISAAQQLIYSFAYMTLSPVTFSKALPDVASLPQVRARVMALPQHPSEPHNKPPALGDRSPCSHRQH